MERGYVLEEGGGKVPETSGLTTLLHRNLAELERAEYQAFVSRSLPSHRQSDMLAYQPPIWNFWPTAIYREYVYRVCLSIYPTDYLLYLHTALSLTAPALFLRRYPTI